MNILGLIGAIAGIIGTLTGIGGLWIAFRANKFTRDQAKKQDEKIAQYRAEDNRPELVPIADKKPQFAEDHTWLDVSKIDQFLALSNTGKGNAYNLGSVLMGSETYVVPGPPPQTRMPNDGYYWMRRSAVPIIPGTSGFQSDQKLHQYRDLRKGNIEIVEGQKLYAPPEPMLGESIRGTPMLTARYTITYRDEFGNKYAGIFDFNYNEQIWYATVLQEKVATDLFDLFAPEEH